MVCIGHVQKRVGTRLSKIKADYKSKKLQGGKGIWLCKGRLTNKKMNTLQNHNGMAICQNTNNLYAMKKSVAAVLFHSKRKLFVFLKSPRCLVVKNKIP